MAKYANFDDREVPEPTPHADRYARFTRNASGRACIFESRGRWVASDVTVAVRR